jgi:hypothetical protein
VEGFAKDGIRLAGVDQPFLVVEMRFAFRAGDETSANCHRPRPKRARAAARPRPLTIPPAARTGVGATASTMSGQQRK